MAPPLANAARRAARPGVSSASSPSAQTKKTREIQRAAKPDGDLSIRKAAPASENLGRSGEADSAGAASGNTSRPSAGETVDPSVRRPFDGEIDIDALGLGLRMARSVIVDDADIRPVLQIGGRHLRQFSVELDRRHLSLRTGQLGEDGRVVAGAGADMHDAISGLHIQMRQHPGVQGRLAIVDPFRRLQGEEGVLVQQGRVVVGNGIAPRCPVSVQRPAGMNFSRGTAAKACSRRLLRTCAVANICAE